MSEKADMELASKTAIPLPCPSDMISVSKAEQISGSNHTFVVTTVVTETTTTSEMQLQQTTLKAVPVEHSEQSITNVATEILPDASTTATTTQETQAVVPLYSSLPSKLLRFHAKRSAQAFLQKLNEQSQSMDSQFGSDESGACGGCDETDEIDHSVNADIFDMPTPTAPPMSPQPRISDDDKLIDVGMGSSIECSEESEEDDELKPLAVDNHLVHDVELNSPTLNSPTRISPQRENSSPPTAVLSEANLRKHHNNHSFQVLDNIYLHPNFKYEKDDNECNNSFEKSPPPAVAPANSPVEQKRTHRSFLKMKSAGTAEAELEKPISVHSHATTASTVEAGVVNEIDSLDPSLVPSEELAAEITEAVEFYFSNDSILKDAFLLKHVRRNKEGFVSLKLVSSFKRVRQLTKEWKVVGNAVRRKSNKIELNDVGTKVRRIDPLPSFDETMPSRTIVACDLPMEKLTIEKVSDIFSKCGEIALIRILKPGMAIPVDVRQFMNKYPEMQQKECALVEYVESSSAREAKHLQGSFQVFDMVAPKKKTGKKAVIQIAAPVARMVENYRYYNDASYERTRGGSFSGVLTHDPDMRYKLKRNNSDFHGKPLAELQHNHNPMPFSPHHQPYAGTHRGSFSSDHSHQYHFYSPRGSFSHESNAQIAGTPPGGNSFYSAGPRRYSNTSNLSSHNIVPTNDHRNTNAPISNNTNAPTMSNASQNGNLFTRRISNCSDTYNAPVESIRRTSNCSENVPQRRDSTCSDNCPCSRRVSDFAPTEVYRKTSQGSIGSNGERRFSNGSMQFERTFSNASEVGNTHDNLYQRRMSNDFNYERKPSIDTQANMTYNEADGNVGGGGGGYQVFPRRYSNNFNVSSKLAAYDNAQYINGRRVSTDSGYDRRCSFGSEYEGSPRSRTGSFLNNYDGQPRSRTGSFLDGTPRSRSGSFAQRAAESLVRTPIGPDGSKGFGSRARKFGQTVSPVN